jgi:hypothetical protein
MDLKGRGTYQTCWPQCSEDQTLVISRSAAQRYGWTPAWYFRHATVSPPQWAGYPLE